ncbi:PKD domain-containing protein [Methanofollis aquaemaris]|uniref:PKD domain-containing protein n=1 Tax=Methanofollis aquaemaris TaxID=126734 RepID=UPI0022400943|nr:PKD domain-containing protein [Methanofollis aquaemaris]
MTGSRRYIRPGKATFGLILIIVLVALIPLAAASAPGAAFSMNVTSGPVPLAVSFTDLSTNAPTSWSWTFGDGNASSEKDPTHVYTKAGTYSANLTATNADGSGSASKTVTVNPPPPVASFSMNVASGPVPLAVSFTDHSTNSPTSWSWAFGDGNVSSQRNPTHVYTTAGTYSATLTATNAGGSDTMSKTVTVNPPPPVASFSMNVAFLSVSFADHSTNAPTSWSWTFGDGTTSIEQNPTHVYTTAGTYSATLTATNAGGSNTTTADVIVTPPAPIAGFSMNVTSGTVPLAVSFTDLSTNAPTSWSWSFGDGNMSSEQNPDHAYATAGTYTVSLTATNTGGSNCTMKNVTVTPPTPVAGFSTNVTLLSVSFTDQSTNAPTSWSWSFGDGNVSSEQNPTHVYATAGTYSATLTATNAGGSNTTTGNVTVMPSAPIADFSMSVTSGPVPLAVSFADLSTNAPTSWLWAFGDGAHSTEQNPVHVYATASTYTVSLTATNGGGSNTTTANVTVKLPPVSDSGDSDTYDIAASGNLKEGASVTLTFHDSAISTINFTAAEYIDGIMVKLETTDDPSPTLRGPVYQYINTTLYYASNDQFDDVVVTFEVPISWISTRGIKVGDIALRYLDGGSWMILPTELKKQTSSTATYRAFAPGISSFAITYAKGATVVPVVSVPTSASAEISEPTPTPATPEPTVTETETTATPTQTGSPAEKTSTSPLILLLLAIGAGVALILFVRRK